MLCSGDPDMELTREVVGSAGHPDTHRLVAQKGRYRPDWDYEKHPHSARKYRPAWVDDNIPRSTLMVYPQFDVHQSWFRKTLITMGG